MEINQEKYLIFDTETTGKPINGLDDNDLNKWPRLVQIAWQTYYNSGKLESSSNFIIKPEGFKIPEDVVKIHGITTERAKKEGSELRYVLYDFLKAVNKSKYLVAHNMYFDGNVVSKEFIRQNMNTDNILKIRKICTQKLSTDFCKIKHESYGYKWPSLSELHLKLFDSTFKEVHNAAIDVETCAKCFFQLLKRGIIDI